MTISETPPHLSDDELDELVSADNDFDREIVRLWQWSCSELGSSQQGDMTEYVDELRKTQERIHGLLVKCGRLSW